MKKIIKRVRTTFNYSNDPYHKYQVKYRKFKSYEYYTMDAVEKLVVQLTKEENEQEIFNKADK